eukprot:COSAG02_NODE_4507_length_5283_cov_3.981674_5_plen_366_part_00
MQIPLGELRARDACIVARQSGRAMPRVWLVAACAVRAACEVSVVDNCRAAEGQEFLPVPADDDLILETYVNSPLSLRSLSHGPREIYSMNMESERLTRISCTTGRREESSCTYMGTSVVSDGSASSIVTLRACDTNLKELKVVIFNSTGGDARIVDGFQSVSDPGLCVFPLMGRFQIPYMEQRPCTGESAAVAAAKLRLRGAAAAAATVSLAQAAVGSANAGARWPQWRAQQWLLDSVAKLGINQPVGMGARLHSRLDEERTAVSAASEGQSNPPLRQPPAVRLVALRNGSKLMSTGDEDSVGSSSSTVTLDFLSVQDLGVVVHNSTQWRYWEPASRRRPPRSKLTRGRVVIQSPSGSPVEAARR